MKSVKKVLFAGVGLTLLASSQAFAAATWDTCSVGKIGVSGTDTQLVQLLNCNTSANSNKWIKLSEQKKNYLAALLTARALDAKVNLKADFDIATTNANPAGLVYNLYLLP